MSMDEVVSARTPICGSHGVDKNRIQRRMDEACSCSSPSSRFDMALRILGIILLPCLTSFGGITLFITGCLTNYSALIIGGAAMFIFGILLCLLCGHICDWSSTKSRDESDNSNCAAV